MARGIRSILMAGVLLVATFASVSASAAPRVIYARTAIGVIHEINLTKRTAIIGGYIYYFGNPDDRDASKVTLYGYHSGAFELLKVGMKVTLRYAEYGVGRYVLSLRQLAPDTDIYKRGVKVDP